MEELKVNETIIQEAISSFKNFKNGSHKEIIESECLDELNNEELIVLYNNIRDIILNNVNDEYYNSPYFLFQFYLPFLKCLKDRKVGDLYSLLRKVIKLICKLKYCPNSNIKQNRINPCVSCNYIKEMKNRSTFNINDLILKDTHCPLCFNKIGLGETMCSNCGIEHR